jgi:RHS repeat-associated protein
MGTATRTSETYSSLDQLTGLTSNGTTTSYAYADTSNNERVTAGNTSFQNGELGLTRQTTGTTSSEFIRDPQGTLIAYRTGNASYYYLFDGQGSVVGLVNTAGTLVNSYSYDPYGGARSTSEQVAQPYRYTGGYLDATGLYKLGYRYYDTSLGRFTQQDPSGQELNAFAYAGDNPTNYGDPAGLLALNLTGAVCIFVCVEGTVSIGTGGISTTTGAGGGYAIGPELAASVSPGDGVASGTSGEVDCSGPGVTGGVTATGEVSAGITSATEYGCSAYVTQSTTLVTY